MRSYLRCGVGGELILLSIGYIEKGCVYISMQKLLSKSIQDLNVTSLPAEKAEYIEQRCPTREVE